MAATRTSIIVNIVLVGETAWEREGRLRGSADLPISDAGRALVRDEAARLAGAKVATIYRPPGEAAAETARLIGEGLKAKVKVVDDLDDAELGLLSGLRREDFAERHPKRHKQWQEDPLSLVPPEGEPLAEARARQFRALARVLRKSRADEVAVILPPMGFGFVRCWMADAPASEVWSRLGEGVRMERYVMPIAYLEGLQAAAEVESAPRPAKSTS